MLTVFDVKHENYNVTTICIRGEELAKFSTRVAGQYAMLKLQVDGEWSQPHPFTISNAPSDDFILMTIKSVGDFTTKLRSIPVGTQAMCDGPFGKFCKDIDTVHSAVFVAGGIGITPFLSVLRYLKDQSSRPSSITLFWANNTAQDFFCMDELCTLSKALNVKMIFVQSDGEAEHKISIPPAETTCFECGYLTKDILSRHADLRQGKIYLCGPPPMVEFVKDELAQCNIDISKIEMEKITIPKRKV